MIHYKRFTDGILGSNTYLLWDPDSREAAVVDAGNRIAPLADLVREQKLTMKYIILTTKI